MNWLLVWWLSVVPSCWAPPVVGPVIDPFRAPACTYCSGHRGVTFAATSGSPVTAVDGGVVRFAGQVAGIRWVVVRHADGRLASYGQLAVVSVVAGQEISAGQVLGVAGRRLYFGLRLDGTPIDPTALLGRWRARLRLVPTDGSPRRPGGQPRLTCAAGVSGR
jgi:murein DD-endopeptidase MepM/ murein hydrolase activator NlpD